MRTTALLSFIGMMVSKGNHPQMALFQVSEIIKGSWEAILPRYGQIKILRIDIDEGRCET